MRHLPLTLALILLGCGDDEQPLGVDFKTPDLLRPDAPHVVLDGHQPNPDLGPGADGQPPAPDGGPPLTDNTLPAWTWYQKSVSVTDRSELQATFAKAGYTPPQDTHLLAARVEPGLSQPAFQLLSLAETGLAFSHGNYWPASTIKVTAAVGALWTLSKHGLSGAASLLFTDDDGTYSGTVKNLYQKALSVSDNVAYNRLAEIAGFDEINDQYLVPATSLPKMVLQRRYTKPLPTSDLRTSPAISYSEGAKSGTIPKRVGTGQHPSCPDSGNCTTLIELLDVLRRVTLHAELPQADRFPLSGADVSGLKAALLAADKDFLEPGASQALGHKAKIENKPGAVWTLDRLDHALIEDTVTGERFLVAWSMPYSSTSNAAASELTRQTLLALKSKPSKAPPLQRDAGVSILINTKDDGPGATPGTRRHTFTISAPGADQLELWLDRFPLPAPKKAGAHFALTHELHNGGDRLLVVRAQAGGKLAGYRAAAVKITAP
jgi:hypothetical protein